MCLKETYSVMGTNHSYSVRNTSYFTEILRRIVLDGNKTASALCSTEISKGKLSK